MWKLSDYFLALECFAFVFLTQCVWGHTQPLLWHFPWQASSLDLLGGNVLVTYCFHMGVAQCIHIILLHYPAHRSCWDSLPPHRGLQPLLLKRKTQKHTIWFSHLHVVAVDLTQSSWDIRWVPASRQTGRPRGCNSKYWWLDVYYGSAPCLKL